MTTITDDPTLIQDYIDRGIEHLWVQTQGVDNLRKEDGLVVIESGDGIYLTDIKGRRFIDAMSGLWVVAVGHGRTELADVAREQMATMAYANTFAYGSKPAVDLATKLAQITPDGINKALFVNSGSEAVETAIRMAKQWHYNRGDKGRYKVISRIGSYHGITAGAMSVNGSNFINRAPFEPLVPGNIAVENVNCARCPYEKTYPECDVFCARTIEDTIKFHRPETIAAFIAEPISTANGCWVPAPEYWRTIRRICDEYDIVMICDEVINGFGRTGEWFGIQHYDVTPDVMTVAKELSSGYLPIAAALASDKIAAGFEGEAGAALVGGSTFGMHPVACAVALANVEIIERENLVANAKKMGAYLETRLQDLQSKHRVVADTRGIGLMHTIEMKRDPESNTDFTDEDAVGERMPRILRDEGILARAGSAIAIAPPLV
ncbi:MAG: aspartate aminotransferase family protein, partial [Chloroflexi bacterium]|nr:aspartate aminotransferase family protein [Chloroflexota bacterium]